MEVKLVQKLASTGQCPLFGIFIDLNKAYDTIDHKRVVEIIYKAGLGPRP